MIPLETNPVRPSEARTRVLGGLFFTVLTTLVACGGAGNSSTGSAGSSGDGGSGASTGASSTGGASTGGTNTGGGGTGGTSSGGSAPGGKVELLAGAVGEMGNIDGPTGTSRLLNVGGMAYIAPNLYVADRYYSLRKIDVQTGVTTTAVDDSGKPTSFFQPTALALGSKGELFVLQGLQSMTDAVVGQVASYQVDSGVIQSEITPDSYEDLPYDVIEPIPFAVEDTGSLLIGDKARVDPATSLISDIGIRKVWGTSATLTAWEPVGKKVYSLHRDPSMVLESDLTSLTWSLVAGEDAPSNQPAKDGPKGVSRFSTRVGGAAYDGSGHLYVADTNANAIRKVDLATGAITTVVGELSPSGTIVVGDIATARLHHPLWVTWLGDGKLAIGCPEDYVVLLASGL